MKLAVVIPALNEEKSIESIIVRCINSVQHIQETTSVKSVDIIVVSDGSTDNTVPLARKYTDKIKLIIFEKNKGYGAAIKEGWDNSDAELLGFLDADGTCEPNFFADLCNLLINENADIALGSRLNPNSQMPLIRKIGNKFYSTILSMVSFEKINDTASGMRVVKRSSLQRIMPLPDGLHFTPAMSARAILSHDLKIVEKDMKYHEREGESKLKVFRDGMRFLGIILRLIVLYQPYKILAFCSIVGFLLCIAMMLFPIIFYSSYGKFEEWMIYRFILSQLVGTISLLLLSAAYLSKKILAITLSQLNSFKGFSILKIFRPGTAVFIMIFFLIIGSALVYDSFIQRITTDATYEHWSRFVVMSFCYSVSFIFIATMILDHILNLINERIVYLRSKKIYQ